MSRILAGATTARVSQSASAFSLTLVLSIVLEPHDYGFYIVVLSQATILFYLTGYWLGITILRDGSAWNIGGAENLVACQISLILILLLLVGPIFVFGGASLALVLCTGAVLLAETAFTLTSNLQASRGIWRNFRLLFFARAALAFLFPLAAALHFRSGEGTIAAYALAVILPSVPFLKLPGLHFKPHSVAGDLLRLLRINYALSANALLRQIVDRGDRLFVAAFIGLDSAGIYGLTSDLVRRPLQTLTGALQASMLPAISKKHREADAAGLASIWKKNGDRVLLLGVSAALGSLLVAVLVGLPPLQGLFPELALPLLCILAFSAMVEVLDTYHIGIAHLLERSLRRVTIVYATGATAFVIAMLFMGQSLTMLMVAAAALGANIAMASANYALSPKGSRAPMRAPLLISVLVLFTSVAVTTQLLA